VSRAGAETVYAIDGTHNGISGPVEIRVIGKREDGGWELSPPASIGATTWQVELTTQYSKAMTLRAGIVSLIAASCTGTGPCDPGGYSLRQGGWDSDLVQELSPEVTARPG
jgi:hypothetical protein